MAPTQCKIPNTTKPLANAYDFFAPNIAVKVGDPPTTFHINAGILCTTSGYFKAALSARKPSGDQPVLELPGYEPAAFNIYLNWLQRGSLFINHSLEKGKGSQNANRETFWENLPECYFLGNKLDDSDFKDALVDAALLSILGDNEGVTWFPGLRIRQRLYERTSPCSCMRRLLVHIAASLTNVKELVHDDDPPAFLGELSRELTIGKEEDTYEVGIACAFHEHELGVGTCYRARKS